MANCFQTETAPSESDYYATVTKSVEDDDPIKFEQPERKNSSSSSGGADPYWHPDKNSEPIDMSGENRNRVIVLGCLILSILVNIVCVILLILAYTKINSGKGSSTFNANTLNTSS